MSAPTRETRAATRRIRRLAYLSAGRAARGFGALLGREITAQEPRLCAASGLAAAQHAETGVVFEIEGSVRGLMALLLPRRGREWLVEVLCPGADVALDTARSALRETGNVVASHAVSAMADQLGARVTLSVPTLVEEGADRAVGRLVDARRARSVGVATRTELWEVDGTHRAMLLFVPDAP